MKIRSRLLTRAAARLIILAMRLLFLTCRRRTKTETENVDANRSTGDARYLYSIWHDQLVMTLFADRPQQMAGLVSRHQDGSYVADTMELLGIHPVRGSTNRGGARALRELMDAAADWHIAITPDGPRGPRHVMKQGLVFLASRTGREIVPVAYGCRREWRIRGSWTDMLLPMPFTEIFVCAGRPLYVPADLEREGLDMWRRVLEHEMHRQEAEVDAYFGRETVVPRTTEASLSRQPPLASKQPRHGSRAA